MSILISYLRKINLFHPTDGTDEDEQQHRSNIYSTRIFFLLLIFILIGFTVGLYLSKTTTRVTIHNPGLDQFKSLPLDAQCPCSDLSFSYGSFITLEASYHQVCSSDFVSDRWIKTIFFDSDTNKFLNTDFRRTGSAQFQGLASFCRILKTNVLDSLTTFYDTSFVNPQVLSEDVLNSIIQSLTDQFNLTVPFMFRSQLNLINKMIFGNQLISGLQTTLTSNYLGFIRAGPVYHGYMFYQKDDDEDYNPCIQDYNYISPSGIRRYSTNNASVQYDQNDEVLLFKIPGWYTGCMPINSLLQSTLECFYNQTCINILLSFLSTNHTSKAMMMNEQSIYKTNVSIQSMIDGMMVEQYNYSISYNKYYEQCGPIACTYLKTERHSLFFIITELIGLVGSLVLILRLLIPPLVQFILKRLAKDKPPSARLSREYNTISALININILCKIFFLVCARLNQLKTFIKTTIIKLNLFVKQPSNEQHIRYQRIGTRLYILIVIIAFIVITVYFLLTKEIYRNTVFNPTESQYVDLQEIYSDSLSCLCTSLSIAHQMFIAIEPLYHPICSSDFVSSNWTDFTLHKQTMANIFQNNLNRLSWGSQFILISTLCEYAQQTINDSIRVFNQTQLVSSQVIPYEIFSAQVKIRIQNWQMNTINEFQRSLQLLRATNEGNKLMNDVFNYVLERDPVIDRINIVPINYSDCSCDLSQTCYGLMNTTWIDPYYLWFMQQTQIDQNFFIGCHALEAMFQSTLECLYSQTCITEKLSILNGINVYGANISALIITNESSDRANETMESIVNRLMINLWQNKTSFSSYFNSCAPSSCTYEYTSRRQLLTIILSLISVIGGLSTVVKIVMLVLIRLVEKISDGFSYRIIGQFIRSLNVCQNEQQLTNCIHFILLTLSLSVFYLAFLVPAQWTTIQILKPSISDYENLLVQHSDSVDCPCSKTSFKYETFLQIEPHFHEICSSDFVSNNWIMYMYAENNLLLRFNQTDFRATAVGQFQLLTSFCQLSKKTIDDTLFQLITTDLINTRLMSESIMNDQMDIMINELRLTTPKSFLRMLALIREITDANKLVSMYSTNWKYNLGQPDGSRIPLYTTPLSYQGCSCGISSKCTQTSRGMMAGCYPLENLLQSTLQCFYNQQCIDPNAYYQALNSSLISTHFHINSTIEVLLEELMVERYLSNVSYTQYFNQCSPTLCSYSYNGHSQTIDILITLLGLYGGLLIITSWFTAWIIELKHHRIRKIRPQINTIS